MTGYVFHCSRCKISHAGECPPESKLIPATWYPAVGSRWKHEVLKPEGWKPSGYPVYEVINFDAESKTVTIEPMVSLYQTYPCSRAAWDESGVVGKKFQYRFVPETP